MSVSEIGQDEWPIGRDGASGEILERQRNMEVYLSSTRSLARVFFCFLSTHATETSSVAFYRQAMYGTAEKNISSHAQAHGIDLRYCTAQYTPSRVVLLIPEFCPGGQRLTCGPTLSTNQMRPWD